MTTSTRVPGPTLRSPRTLYPTLSPTLSPRSSAIRRAAARAAIRRGSATTTVPSNASASASGTSVVFPVPGGATSTALPSLTASTTSPSTRCTGRFCTPNSYSIPSSTHTVPASGRSVPRRHGVLPLERGRTVAAPTPHGHGRDSGCGRRAGLRQSDRAGTAASPKGGAPCGTDGSARRVIGVRATRAPLPAGRGALVELWDYRPTPGYRLEASLDAAVLTATATTTAARLPPWDVSQPRSPRGVAKLQGVQFSRT